MRQIVLMLAISLSVSVAAQSRPSRADQDSLKLALQKIDADHATRYIAAYYDLDGDGTPEAIVYLIGHGSCGSGGCDTFIFKRDRHTWSQISDISITRLPIRVLANKTNGWHDLGVWVQGGGIQPGYEAQLRFNGRTYPENPSIPPATKAAKGTKGEAIIKSAEEARPLFAPQ
jgi:hypothetical protein